MVLSKKLSLILILAICCAMVFAISDECTDSDDGKSYGVKGETYDKGAAIPYVDRCTGPSVLTEHFCNEEGRLEAETFTCEGRCEDGACTSFIYKTDVKVTTAPAVEEKLENGEKCEDNSDCESDYCKKEVCSKKGFFKRFFEKIGGFFKRLWPW